MTKVERAIRALEELPPHRGEEIAEIVLELAAVAADSDSALSDEQLAEVRRRRADGFRRGDASRIDQLLKRLV